MPEESPLLGGAGRPASVFQKCKRTARRACDAVARSGVWRLAVLVLAVVNVWALLHVVVRRLPRATPVADDVCESETCVDAAYTMIHSLNETADPCEDFFAFATGGWQASHPIPKDQGAYEAFQVVEDANDKVMRRILTELPASNKVDQQNLGTLRTFYGACMNTDAQDKLGTAPLLDELRALHSVLTDSKAPLADTLAWLHARGYDALFSSDISGDAGKAPLLAIPEVSPGGLGLPDPAYYEDKKAVDMYRDLIVDAVRALHKEAHSSLLPMDMDADAVALAIVAFEAEVAKITPDMVELSDPVGIYNPISPAALEKMAPAVDWRTYFKRMSGERATPKSVIIASPAYMKKLSKLLETTPKNTVHAYLYWTVVRDAGRFLGPNVTLGEPARRLNRFTRGVDVDVRDNRESQCLKATNSALGLMSGRFFVQEAFGFDSKTQVERIIDQIRKAFYRRLHTIPWLDGETRKAALRKAEWVAIEVGYPTVPNTESATSIRDWYADLAVGDAYFANRLAARKFEVAQQWARLGGEILTGMSAAMVPSEVNAFYNPPHNEIVFPAGILQAPFFHPRWPMYMQYGAFGAVAGHELSHAFDPNGRLYDAEGLLHDWWTPRTASEFHARQKCIEEQYGNYTIDDGEGHQLHLQSRFSVGEDVADAGGIAQSYRAWRHQLASDPAAAAQNKRLPGLSNYTPEQIFFLVRFFCLCRPMARRGRAMCGRPRPCVSCASYVLRLTQDPHSPGKYRVNGVLANFPPFAEAFQCKRGTPMAPKERCEIW